MDTIFGIGIIATFIFIVVMCFDKSEHSVRPASKVVMQDNRRVNININVALPADTPSSRGEAEAIIARASQQYGVPTTITEVIWRLESTRSLKGRVGKNNALQAIRTQQRRSLEASKNASSKKERERQTKRFKRYIDHENNLIAIAQRCDYNLNTLPGSETGAINQFQQMPNTIEWIGKDGNGDGKVCPLDFADAAFTAAAFLKNRFDNKTNKSQSDRMRWQSAIRQYAGAGPKARAYAERAMRLAKK